MLLFLSDFNWRWIYTRVEVFNERITHSVAYGPWHHTKPKQKEKNAPNRMIRVCVCCFSVLFLFSDSGEICTKFTSVAHRTRIKRGEQTHTHTHTYTGTKVIQINVKPGSHFRIRIISPQCGVSLALCMVYTAWLDISMTSKWVRHKMRAARENNKFSRSPDTQHNQHSAHKYAPKWKKNIVFSCRVKMMKWSLNCTISEWGRQRHANERAETRRKRRRSGEGDQTHSKVIEWNWKFFGNLSMHVCVCLRINQQRFNLFEQISVLTTTAWKTYGARAHALSDTL